MPFDDLSQVTTALTTLLKKKIRELDPGLATDPTVATVAPELATEGTDATLNLYLYHVTEDPYFKSAPQPGTGQAPVQREPMPLCLYYLLTGHQDMLASQSADQVERLLTLAMRSIHEHPLITEATMIGATQVLPAATLGRNNRLLIEPRNVTPEQASAFWGTEQQKTTRLSAFYEVRGVFIQPQPATRLPSPVLAVATFSHSMPGPWLDASESTVHFTRPVAQGGVALTLDASPAQVSLVQDAALSPPANELVLRGHSLRGVRQQLYLQHQAWGSEIVPVEWATVSYGASEVRALVETTAGTKTILPGLYGAFIRVVEEEQLLLGTLKQITRSSNRLAFTIAPRITDVALTGSPVTELAITLPGFDPTDPSLTESIELALGGATYERTTGTPAAGQFSVAYVSTDAVLTLTPITALPSGDVQPLRILVDGASTQPYWIEVP